MPTKQVVDLVPGDQVHSEKYEDILTVRDTLVTEPLDEDTPLTNVRYTNGMDEVLGPASEVTVE